MQSKTRNLRRFRQIMELKQAIFFNHSSAVLKFPTAIINALHVDEVGQVWFLVRQPRQNLNEFDGEFDARLEFYRKGADFSIHVFGKACLVVDPEEIMVARSLSAEIAAEPLNGMVLVRLKIEQLTYFELIPKSASTLRLPDIHLQPLTFFKSLQDVAKNIIPVFQSH